MILDQQLIFLISQPRAGSTLLQRILGGHPDIYTLPEPWLMLHPLYALRKTGIQTDYDDINRTSQFALQTYLKNISLRGEVPEEIYYEGIRRMYGFLYERSLNISGKLFFLDKTPRYYHIISDLSRIFPNAKFLILLRNPIAVLLSMLKTWAQNDWFWLSHISRRHDLITAPIALIDGIKKLDGNCEVIRYEDLVTQPQDEIKRLTSYLGIDFSPNLINYGDNNIPKWSLGDKKNLYEFQRPVGEFSDNWKNENYGSETWRLLHDYLLLLGNDVFNQLGYSYDECFNILEKCKPNKFQRMFTYSLEFFLTFFDERNFIERNLLRLVKIGNLIPKA